MPTLPRNNYSAIERNIADMNDSYTERLLARWATLHDTEAVVEEVDMAAHEINRLQM